MSQAKQGSLFGEPGGETRLTLSQEIAGKGKPADKNLAKLQRLIQQIEQERELLQQWRDYIPVYQQTLQRDFLPLQEELAASRRAMAFAIDKALKTRGILTGKVQRRQAGELIGDLCAELLSDKDDAELEALHDEYNDLTYAEEMALESALKQDMISALLGVRIEDGADEEAIIAAVREKQKELQAEWEAAQSTPSKTPSKRAQAAEKLAEEASLSVRQVFRKLASTLHPDRETDPAERERKTALMQRVNDAYARNDLLVLLSLQYEIEQIDTEHLSQLDAKRQKHYIHLLTEQLNELKQEVHTLRLPFQEMLGKYSARLRPNDVAQRLRVDIALLKSDINKARQDVIDCQNKENLKRWIKDNYQTADDWDPYF